MKSLPATLKSELERELYEEEPVKVSFEKRNNDLVIFITPTDENPENSNIVVEIPFEKLKRSWFPK